MHKIEGELGTEIKPIPKVIDPRLYVAEYQQEGSFDQMNQEQKAVEYNKEYEQQKQQQQQQSNMIHAPLQQLIAQQ